MRRARVEPPRRRAVAAAGRPEARADRILGVTTVSAPPLAVPSVLVVLPAPPGADTPAPDTMIAGLPLLRRIVLAAARAGFERILVHPRACPEPGLLDGTP